MIAKAYSLMKNLEVKFSLSSFQIPLSELALNFLVLKTCF